MRHLLLFAIEMYCIKLFRNEDIGSLYQDGRCNYKENILERLKNKSISNLFLTISVYQN
jgi:hypothetical protein